MSLDMMSFTEPVRSYEELRNQPIDLWNIRPEQAGLVRDSLRETAQRVQDMLPAMEATLQADSQRIARSFPLRDDPLEKASVLGWTLGRESHEMRVLRQELTRTQVERQRTETLMRKHFLEINPQKYEDKGVLDTQLSRYRGYFFLQQLVTGENQARIAQRYGFPVDASREELARFIAFESGIYETDPARIQEGLDKAIEHSRYEFESYKVFELGGSISDFDGRTTIVEGFQQLDIEEEDITVDILSGAALKQGRHEDAIPTAQRQYSLRSQQQFVEQELAVMDSFRHDIVSRFGMDDRETTELQEKARILRPLREREADAHKILDRINIRRQISPLLDDTAEKHAVDAIRILRRTNTLHAGIDASADPRARLEGLARKTQGRAEKAQMRYDIQNALGLSDALDIDEPDHRIDEDFIPEKHRRMLTLVRSLLDVRGLPRRKASERADSVSEQPFVPAVPTKNWSITKDAVPVDGF